MITEKTYYPTGQFECEGFLIGEVRVGNWIFYYENGKVFSRGRFDKNGIPTGIWTEYYENGQIKYDAISPQGNCFTLDSNNLEIINYWTEDGIPTIVEGNGKLSTYFENGSIQHISYWTNKLKNGTLQEFFENGQLAIERNYKDGFQDGCGKVFFKNGNIYLEHWYQNGKFIGPSREWYENGQLSEEGEYINGEYFPIKFWTEDGDQILKDGTGKKIEKYGAGGYDIYEQTFEQGIMTSEKNISKVTYGQFIPNGS